MANFDRHVIGGNKIRRHPDVHFFEAPYVIAGNVTNVRTGINSSNYTYGPCNYEYTVVLLCPTAMINDSSTNQKSGIMFYKTSVNTTFSDTTIASSGQTFVELFGGDFDSFAEHGLVYAAEVSMRVQAPAATLQGNAYVGSMTYE